MNYKLNRFQKKQKQEPIQVNVFLPEQPKKKEISYGLSRWSAIAGIAGAFLGLILSGWSIGISIQASNNATKIEKMDSLLRKQDSLIGLIALQNYNQQQQINQLKEIDSNAVVTAEKISEQIIVTKHQTDYLQEAQAPNINIINLEVKPTGEKFMYDVSFELKNVGLRNALIQDAFITFYHIKNNKIISSYKDDSAHLDIGKSTLTVLKPNSSTRMSHEFEIDDLKILENIYVEIRLYYKDTWFKNTQVEEFYYQLKSNGNNEYVLYDIEEYEKKLINGRLEHNSK